MFGLIGDTRPSDGGGYDKQSVHPARAGSPSTDPQGRPTRVRHAVLALTVAAYMVTDMDRVVISSAVPAIQKEFGFSIITMGWILGSFRWAYSTFQIPVAWLGDRYGSRRALTAIVLWWSLLTSATTMAWSAASMIAIRFLFGAGEAGAFPIATRSLSRWMLPSERGFAQGITHAGLQAGRGAHPLHWSRLSSRTSAGAPRSWSLAALECSGLPRGSGITATHPLNIPA